tara:strand:- start:5160 stop:6086 length:927 start_codon:yes stop_codon:yes gene_type:complete
MTSIKDRTEIAKANPRNIKNILDEIETLSTLSEDVAFSCFYVIIGEDKPIVGISVRLAELIASSWGNIHSGARIMSKNQKEVTVQGFVHDFEKNSIFTVEVQRSTFGLTPERAIHSTNAASSIAFRNAVFKAIPASLTQSIVSKIKHYILNNDSMDVMARCYNVIEFFKSKNINEQQVSDLLGRKINYDLDNIRLTNEDMFLLMGLKNAIEEGDTTLEEAFKIKTKVSKPSRFNWGDDEPKKMFTPKVEELEFKKALYAVSEPNLKNSIASMGIQNEVEKAQEISNEIDTEELKIEKPKRKRGRPKKD